MITIGTIRHWQPAALEEAIRTLLRHRDALTSLQDEVTGCRPPASWTGRAADHAAPDHQKIDQAAQRLTGEVAAVLAAALDAADSIGYLRVSLTEAENLAHHHDYVISDSGALETRAANPGQVASPDRRAAQLELEERVRELLRRAADIDIKLAHVLSRASRDQLKTSGTLEQAAHAGAQHGALEITPPPPANTAGANAAWWASLSPPDQRMVLATRPDWIGNLDGVPARFRDHANRARLNHLLATLRQQQDQFTRGGAGDEHYKLKLTILDLETIEKELNKGPQQPLDGPTLVTLEPPRQLLLLDANDFSTPADWSKPNDFTKAAVATGDVDHAQHVAVQTPGITSSVQESLELKQEEMTRLHRESGDQTFAGITWIGYEPPSMDPHRGPLDPWQTFADDKAIAGANDLEKFYKGINASHHGIADPHLTGLGHSYGGVTTEYALTREGTGVDDAVVYGTPGHPVGDASKLHLQDSLYTLSSGDEHIENGGAWGAILSRGDIVGDVELSAAGVDGHSDYLKSETTSYDNIRKVVLDDTGTVVREEP